MNEINPQVLEAAINATNVYSQSVLKNEYQISASDFMKFYSETLQIALKTIGNGLEVKKTSFSNDCVEKGCYLKR